MDWMPNKSSTLTLSRSTNDSPVKAFTSDGCQSHFRVPLSHGNTFVRGKKKPQPGEKPVWTGLNQFGQGSDHLGQGVNLFEPV